MRQGMAPNRAPEGSPMDPQVQFCQKPECPSGQPDLGNIRVHSRKERLYRCTPLDRTIAATHDTAFYRFKRPTELVTIDLALLCRGCPPQIDRRRLRD